MTNEALWSCQEARLLVSCLYYQGPTRVLRIYESKMLSDNPSLSSSRSELGAKGVLSGD